MKRETFGSRLGFILVSAGCAIGIGNVWKFPYLCGEMGGAAFILIYLVFLFVMGIPVLVTEFAVGRASRYSVAAAYEKLEPEGSRWHHTKWIGIIGSYLLMMFYTTVGGWMLYYCYRCVTGEFVGASSEDIQNGFGQMIGSPSTMAFWTILITVVGFVICWFGIQKGVERVTKVMMIALLLIMIVLAAHSFFLEGAEKGIEFYLIPNFKKMAEIGIGNVIFGAMSQAFFTLSIGIGAMMIFGSYMGKDRSLTGEAINITILDTFVALMAGFIIIPACFAFNIQPDAGPNLISNNLLPLGSLGYLLFITRKNGWGWENFLAEVNTGKGLKFPAMLKAYVGYGIPVIIMIIYLKGYYDKFSGMSTAAFVTWMMIAVLFLGFVLFCALTSSKKKV